MFEGEVLSGKIGVQKGCTCGSGTHAIGHRFVTVSGDCQCSK